MRSLNKELKIGKWLSKNGMSGVSGPSSRHQDKSHCAADVVRGHKGREKNLRAIGWSDSPMKGKSKRGHRLKPAVLRTFQPSVEGLPPKNSPLRDHVCHMNITATLAVTSHWEQPRRSTASK